YPRIIDAFDKPQYREVLDIALKIDGLKRHSGIHAAGVIILPTEHSMPLTKAKDEDEIITQWNDKTALKLGYLKVDLLGLRTLKVIRDSIDWIRKLECPDFYIEKIPFDDKKTFDFIANNSLIGVFQMESRGINELTKKVKPKSIDEIAHVIALYRPGIIEAGMLEAYIERKNSGNRFYIVEQLKDILEETYGVVVFQEQAMRIAQRISNFSPQEADEFRKVIAKKIPEEMEKYKEKFINGAVKNGYSEKIAADIFSQMERFGEYVFNKSHATAYAYLTYITAYLKANYPLEFFVSLISSEIGRSQLGSREKEPKIILFLSDAKNMNIKILKPDINLSDEKFKPERTKAGIAIRYGLLAIKNVGYSAVTSIIEERIKNGDFKSFENFMIRMKKYRAITKKVVESLIKAGAFDSLYDDEFYNTRTRLIKKLEENQVYDELFSTNDTTEVHINAVLSAEMEVLGDYITAHPLTKYKKEVEGLPLIDLKDVDGKKGRLVFGGMVRKSKKIKNFYIIELEDFTSKRSVLYFPRKNEEDSKIKSANFIVAVGSVSNRRSDELIADEILTIEEAKKRFKRSLLIELNASIDLSKIKKIFDENPGDSMVYIKVEGKKILIDKRIEINDRVLKNISTIIGEGNVRVIFEDYKS
ncbi:MAG: DNA polymerase III subunit alpha, partial [bacterium]|nr:DNA polymerase III subunit alpha [bacterium]